VRESVCECVCVCVCVCVCKCVPAYHVCAYVCMSVGVSVCQCEVVYVRVGESVSAYVVYAHARPWKCTFHI